MRKLSQLLLLIIFILPMLIGGMSMLGVFSNASNLLLATSNGGGGGGNSLDDPSAGKKTPENTQETTYTFKTYEDYFIDYEIPETLKGDGSKQKPYQVENLEDFLCLTTMNCRSKYIEIKHDVFLNDETFDEKGNPSGGDGVVYNWDKSFTLNQMVSLDGYSNTIFGLYINTSISTSLFGYSAFTEIKNLNVDNFYACVGEQSSVLTKEANKLKNCKIKKGYASSTKPQVSALCRWAGLVENCENYANIKGVDFVSGLVHNARSLTNCSNYGEIYGAGSNVAGLLVNPNCENLLFVDCSNHGKIKGYNHVGGFAPIFAARNSNFEFINCVASGKIETTYTVASATYAGGFVATSYSKIAFINCNNQATISTNNGYYSGFFIGASKKEVYVKDCQVDVCALTKSGSCLVGRGEKELYVDGCDIVIRNYSYVNNPLLFVSQGVTKVSNVNIKLFTDKEKEVVYLAGSVGENSSFSNINLFTNFDISTFKVASKSVVVQKGIVVQSKNLLFYYGNNFSGFYFSWRTGQIGLVALDGRGSFQGSIDEEWLLNKGFEKKEI